MRSWNVGRNAAVGLACQIIILILNFLTRTVFTKCLASEYLGITGLFSNVLSILSLSELGIGSAIVYALYRPFAEDNQDKIRALIRFYKKAYSYIGTVIFFLGVALIPFLPYLIKEKNTSVNILIIFALYLFQSVISYWFLAYRSAMLTASQNEYVITLVNCLCTVCMCVFQMTVLLCFKGQDIALYLYIFIQVLSNIAMNGIISYVVGKKYPYINSREESRLEQIEKQGIFRNVFGLSLYRITSTINSSADSIIISSFVNITSVGLYSNYTLLQLAVVRILGVIYNPLTASIGNLNVTESKEKNKFIFDCLNLMSFWTYGFCSICLFILLNPFIGGIWLGKEWLLDEKTVAAFVIKFLIDGLLAAVIKFREAAGLFYNARIRYLLSVVINVSTSIFFVYNMKLGIFGVLVGSILAELLTLAIDPIIVFKYVFQKKAASFYFTYFKYLLIILATTVLLRFITGLYNSYSILGFAVSLMICMILPNLIWFLLFRNTEEFKYLSKAAFGVVNRVKSKLSKEINEK
ncbi:oligosaccharide flippase family protein [Acetatifactor muris]|uniref:Polysaccharide biosynthesis protein n=1 Tax=Acetatifactor muris TaxID=879566 RepID=A0A2K4ZEK8_9FIRM|nr:oligosaccharide flippase family protein [Acetatifactor muris]MCR2048498.1 oligosaccharide flippase family protein [Acetatifactor muris]SOY28890.1 Polysaccharide biosynthesis protein [Acetatifactor muris]